MDLSDRNQVLYTLRYREHNNIDSKLSWVVKKIFLSIFRNYMKWRENRTKIFWNPHSPQKKTFFEHNFGLDQDISQ